MDDMDVIEEVVKLIKRIKVVTGWPVPELEEDRFILYQELAKHFQESWPNINPEEIAFAVRFYGTSVDNWGKDINLNLIDRCIGSYYAKRKELSEVEEQKTPDAIRLPPPEPNWSEVCEYRYQDFINAGGMVNIRLWPHELYDAIAAAGFIESDLYDDFLREAESMILLEDGSIAKVISSPEQQKIFMAKRLAVRYVFKMAVEAGHKNLFVKA